MKLRDAWELVRDAFSAWSDDYAPSMGAALSYYTLFSIAPLLLIVISVAGLVFGEEAARGEIVSQLGDLLGKDGAAAIQGLLESAGSDSRGIVGAALGFLMLVIGATTVFGELQDALDRIWRAPQIKKRSGLLRLLRARLLSFSMVLCIGFLLIVSLIASAAVSAWGNWLSPMLGAWEVIAQALNFAISFAIVTLLFAMIYKLMPRVKIAWRDVWVGAVVTALLFSIGKFVIGLYIGKSGVASSFGAASSLVAMLVWVYYSAQIFLIGAEFTWVYSHRFGSLKGKPRPRKSEPHPAMQKAEPAPSAAARSR